MCAAGAAGAGAAGAAARPCSRVRGDGAGARQLLLLPPAERAASADACGG